MLTALLTAAVLAATPAKAPARKEPGAAAAAQAPAPSVPPFEVLIPQKMLEDFLWAAMPVKRSVTEDVEVLGMASKVNLEVTLSRPRVHVTPAGIGVTLDFHVDGPAGLSADGVTTPKFELTVLEGQHLLEGKMTGATISETGLELPLGDVVPPVRFPAGAMGPVQVGDVTVLAEAWAKEVSLEDGQVRVKGTWTFKKPEPAKAPRSAPEKKDPAKER